MAIGIQMTGAALSLMTSFSVTLSTALTVFICSIYSISVSLLQYYLFINFLTTKTLKLTLLFCIYNRITCLSFIYRLE